MERVVVRSDGRLSSLGWMALAVCLGFPFIAVGLEPGGKTINLAIGIPVFAFLFALALWDLGMIDHLTLDTLSGRGLLLRGRYHRRDQVEFSLKEVSRVVLVMSHVATGGKSNPPAAFYDLRFELRDGRSFSVALPRRLYPEEEAFRVGRALGLRVEHEGRNGVAP